MTAQPLAESRLPLPLLRRGKVREVYEVDAGHMLLVASDRVRAFDIVMREAIPRKGAVLTQMSAHWFERLAGVVPSHFVTASTGEILDRVPALRPLAEVIAGRTMLVRRTTPTTRLPMGRLTSLSARPAAGEPSFTTTSATSMLFSANVSTLSDVAVVALQA